MAILPDCPGLRVEIHVNGQPLREYDCDDEGIQQKTVSKYVEVVSGAFFGIRCHFTKGFQKDHSLLLDIQVDGQSVNRPIVLRSTLSRLPHTASFDDAYSRVDGLDYVQRFRFSQLAIDEGSSGVDNGLAKSLAETGQITVRLTRITNLRAQEKPANDPHKHVRHNGMVPEKALKGRADSVTHYAKLEEPQLGTKRQIYLSDNVDKDGPMATFHFKYKSLAALKVLRVIPRTPSPVPLEDRPAEELSNEELQELVRKLKQKAAAAPTVKQEAHSRLAFKREIEEDEDVTLVSSKRVCKDRRLPRDDDEVIELD